MSWIIDNFNEVMNDMLTIEWDGGQKKINRNNNGPTKSDSNKINLYSPQIVKVLNSCNIWPTPIQVTVDKQDNVTVESYCCCTVSPESSPWKVIPNTGVNAFCLKISAKETSIITTSSVCTSTGDSDKIKWRWSLIGGLAALAVGMATWLVSGIPLVGVAAALVTGVTLVEFYCVKNSFYACDPGATVTIGEP